DREQVALERSPRVVVWKTRQKANEGFLDDVFTRRSAMQAAVDERQQASLILRNENVPRFGPTGEDLLHQQNVGVRRITHPRLRYLATNQPRADNINMLPIIAAGTPKNNHLV